MNHGEDRLRKDSPEKKSFNIITGQQDIAKQSEIVVNRLKRIHETLGLQDVRDSEVSESKSRGPIIDSMDATHAMLNECNYLLGEVEERIGL